MNIRRANSQDFLSIACLDRKAWKKNRNSDFIPDGEHAWRLWVEFAIVFCAEINNEIVGAILAFPCQNGKYCIHKVFVKSEARGKGIGSKLFSSLLKEIDFLNAQSFLTVDPTNQDAISLYEKWGYTEKLFIEGFYRQNEDRYLLTRQPAK